MSQQYEESDAVSIPEAAADKLTVLTNLLDPLSRPSNLSLPVSPDNDLPYLPLNITTQAILSTGDAGKGFIIAYPGLPFRKVCEHYIINDDNSVSTAGMVLTSVNASESFIAARPTSWSLSAAANFLLNTGGVTSATVQGLLSGTEAFGGLSQLYQANKAVGVSFSMDSLSQLIANPSMKLSGLNATEGIAYKAPPTNGEFIRLNDDIPITVDSGANENLDWSLVNVVSVRQGLEDADGWSNNISFPIGTLSKTFVLPAISIDVPYHCELTMMYESFITNVTNGANGTNFDFDIFADFYDVTRDPANVKTYQFKAGHLPSTVQVTPLWGTMLKVLPDEDETELHYTWTALQWRVVISRNSSTVAMTLNYPSPPVLATKVSEPLYLGRGKAQAPIIFSYAGLPASAPLAINSSISLEVVPDTQLSKITSPQLRFPSDKTWRMTTDFINQFQKMGKSWFYAANGVGPYCPKSHSKEIKFLIAAVFAKHYPQYSHLVAFQSMDHNPEFASKATKWFRKLNRKLKRVGSKGLNLVGDVVKDVGGEALNIGKDILKQRAYQELGLNPALSDRANVSNLMRDNMTRAINSQFTPGFASGASFSGYRSQPRFSSRMNSNLMDDFTQLPVSRQSSISDNKAYTSNETYLASADSGLAQQPRVFAVSETCYADSDMTLAKKGDLWCLTYPTPNLMSWLENVYGVKYEPRNFWSRIGTNFLIGHTGNTFSIPNLRRDVILLHVAKKSPLTFDYIGTGRGDSLTLALYALANVKYPVDLAFTGPVINGIVQSIPKSTLHAKWLGDHGTPLVANAHGLYNTIPINSISELPRLLGSYGPSLGPMFMGDPVEPGKGTPGLQEPKASAKVRPKQSAKNAPKTQGKQGPQSTQKIRQPNTPSTSNDRGTTSQSSRKPPINKKSKMSRQAYLQLEWDPKETNDLVASTLEISGVVLENIYSSLARLMFPTGRWAFSSPNSSYFATIFVELVTKNAPAGPRNVSEYVKALTSAILQVLIAHGDVYHSSFAVHKGKTTSEQLAKAKKFLDPLELLYQEALSLHQQFVREMDSRSYVLPTEQLG